MPVPSLYDIARSRIISNISMLTDIGDLPYSFLAPILKHIQNPSQLLELETTCPQILGETGEIWLRFIKRDIPNWDKKPHQPRDPSNWSKVYRKLKRDAEREQEEQEEALRQQMRALQKDRSENKTTIVNANVGYNPAARRRGGGGGRGFSSASSSWGPAPTKTGKVALDKFKRGMFDQKQARPKVTQIPAHLLEERRGKVAHAPERMIRMNENIDAPAPAPKSMLVPRKASLAGRGVPHPALHRPAISSRPPPQLEQNAKMPEKTVRTSLPADKHFTAPKLQTQTPAAAAPQKRRREEANPFMPRKRRP
ncbi:uncharacterized protein BDR25DRAFT_330792 [Lindgomyces ingoldianus]|uniref:Uncharacterized protein n=1 Tax=Lindgomyces ingoldianus TaxID=673940 RepID=A0ACB6RIG9_9PLEO|nr:uncharacterized protein BDR25DRAFT_330792 [Lindgomyces ingoldianus]KAF2478317.1 hypothetical protein BDR25DRAFT_330792 [Lindgomyces ingoldianus]